MMDVLMCSSGQYRIWSCKVVVNSGYAHVQWWSMEGYQICSCVRVIYAMVDTMICRFNLRCSDVIVEDLKATKHDNIKVSMFPLLLLKVSGSM